MKIKVIHKYPFFAARDTATVLYAVFSESVLYVIYLGDPIFSVRTVKVDLDHIESRLTDLAIFAQVILRRGDEPPTLFTVDRRCRRAEALVTRRQRAGLYLGEDNILLVAGNYIYLISAAAIVSR